MMEPQTRQHTLPEDLRSPRAKLVYLYLSMSGSATVNELQDALEMKKITLYSILKTLRERELVGQEMDRYVLT